MTRVLLTGSLGFVGSAILQRLHKTHPEYELIATDIKQHDDLNRVPEGATYATLDVRDLDQVTKVIGAFKPNVIVHTAGLVPNGFPRYSRDGRDDLFKLNVTGTENMLSASKAVKTVKAFVFTGSITCHSDDLDHSWPNLNESTPYPRSSLIYGESKAVAERLVLDSNSADMVTCSLRPSTIMGREDYQLIPAIQACIAKGETPYIIGDGDNLYEFTFVDNVAHGHVLTIENLLTTKTAAGEAILITNQQAITFRDFMKAIWAQFGHVPPFEVTIPAGVAWWVGAIAEFYHRVFIRSGKATLCRGSVKDAMQTAWTDPRKAQEILGYRPIVDVWDGVRISCDALKARIEQNKQTGSNMKGSH